MARFGTFLFDEEVFGGEATFPIEGVTRVPWIFRDIASDDEYEFAVNPLDCSIPSPAKTITTEYTAAGSVINWQGRDPVQKMTFSGTILTEEHYYAMKQWAEKSTQINVTDDLGRNYWIFINSFSPTRKYVPSYPWRHEYSVDATILSWN